MIDRAFVLLLALIAAAVAAGPARHQNMRRVIAHWVVPMRKNMAAFLVEALRW